MKATQININTKEQKQQNDYAKAIVDSSMFVAGEQINGIAFVKSFSARQSQNGRDYVILYLKDRNNRTFNAYLFNLNREITTTEVLTCWLNKVVIIEGTISNYRGSLNVELIRLDECPKEFNLTSLDFMPVADWVDEGMATLESYLTFLSENGKQSDVDAIRAMDLPRRLKNSLTNSKEGRVGDGLLVLTDMLMLFQPYARRVTSEIYAYYISFLIYSMGLIGYSMTQKNKNERLLDTSITDHSRILLNTLIKHKAFGPLHEKGIQEFKHLYECFYMGATPQTLLTKFFINNYHALSRNYEIGYLEEKTSPGNSHTFQGEVHTHL